MRLLNTTSNFTVYRIPTNTGYITDDGDWVEGASETSFTINCSIQPFRNGDQQLDLPEGVRADDAVFVYTKTPLQTKDDQKNTEADEIVLDSLRYECFFVENWSRYNLSTDHYKCVFIRKDKL